MHSIAKRFCWVALACVALVAWASLAEAKRFKRYLDDTEEQNQSEPSQVPQRDQQGVAEDAAEEDYEPEEAPGLFGYALHGQNGLTVQYIYTGDVFTNMRGGINTRNATEYLGLFDLAITADLDHYGLAPGGTFFMLGEDFHGRGIGDHVGDYQGTDNIDAGRQNMQVSEFWWERGILDGLITVRLGKQDANAEFGVFDGAADGRTWGFSGTGEVFSIYEFKATWALLSGRLPGDMHLGMWHHNGHPEDPGNPAITYADNHGVHLGFDQMIYKESWDEDDDQGLGVFVHYGWAPEERNEVPNYIGGGLVYKGLVPGRDDDMVGAGVANVFFSDRMGLPSDHETAVEVYYKMQLSPYIVVQPDLQVVTSPSGVERDAFVAGLRFELVL